MPHPAVSEHGTVSSARPPFSSGHKRIEAPSLKARAGRREATKAGQAATSRTPLTRGGRERPQRALKWHGPVPRVREAP